MTVAAERVNEVRASMLKSIGKMNILAISGGRLVWLDDFTLKLPISNGYSVEVEYDRGWDAYIVRRVFTRREKGVVVRRVKGEVRDVYFDHLGETCWRAHAFRSYEFGS
jgi:hypothetical protein